MTYEPKPPTRHEALSRGVSMRKPPDSVSVLASVPLHGGPSVHAATDGMCLPGAWRSALAGFAAADEPAGRPAPGVGPERTGRIVREELNRKI
jgi:hypothetical protein